MAKKEISRMEKLVQDLNESFTQFKEGKLDLVDLRELTNTAGKLNAISIGIFEVDYAKEKCPEMKTPEPYTRSIEVK